MKNKYWLGLTILILWIIALLFYCILPIGLVFQNCEIYLHYSDFKKEKVYVDTLQNIGSSKSGKYISYIGYTDIRKLTISHFQTNQKTIEELEPLFEEYEKNGKYLNIWVSPNTKDAYFDTSALNNTTQLKLWYQPLIEICIFILMTFILVRWSKYFKKELSKYGLTTSEFHKLRKEGKLNEYLKNYENKQD